MAMAMAVVVAPRPSSWHSFQQGFLALEQSFVGASIEVLLVIHLFLGIAYAADDYFVESLNIIASKVGMSDDVAGSSVMPALLDTNSLLDHGVTLMLGSRCLGLTGATLMALGCSAPEFFTNVGSVIFSSDSTTNPTSLFEIEATPTLVEPQPDRIGLDWVGSVQHQQRREDGAQRAEHSIVTLQLDARDRDVEQQPYRRRDDEQNLVERRHVAPADEPLERQPNASHRHSHRLEALVLVGHQLVLLLFLVIARVGDDVRLERASTLLVRQQHVLLGRQVREQASTRVRVVLLGRVVVGRSSLHQSLLQPIQPIEFHAHNKQQSHTSIISEGRSDAAALPWLGFALGGHANLGPVRSPSLLFFFLLRRVMMLATTDPAT